MQVRAGGVAGVSRRNVIDFVRLRCQLHGKGTPSHGTPCVRGMPFCARHRDASDAAATIHRGSPAALRSARSKIHEAKAPDATVGVSDCRS